MSASTTSEFIAYQQNIEDFVIRLVGMIQNRLDQKLGRSVRRSHTNDRVRAALIDVLRVLERRYDIDVEAISEEFACNRFDRILALCEEDVMRYPLQDPALEDLEEVFHASNGFWATVAYRVAHELAEMKVPVLPRAISRIAHSRTGVDIHPLAKIDGGLFIDHGTGIAIGCTAVLKKNVNLYNGVVLGTSTKPRMKKDAATGELQQRHPTILENVSLYTNAFVGGDVVVGAGAVIGAYAFVCRNVKPGEVVVGKREPQDPPEVDPEISRFDEAIVEMYIESEADEVTGSDAECHDFVI